MTSLTISPSIDQAALQTFVNNFHLLAQQTNSRLGSSPAVVYLPSRGKTHNMARMGRVELVEVETRNPNKQYGDYAVDNRQLSKRRFTRTITIDKKNDINELIADPTSDILAQLLAAKERMIDRVIASAAVGPVLTGPAGSTPTSTSAANDGVLTVDATSGVTYEKVQEITENFINNDLDMAQIQGTCLAISGTENTDLMGEDEFINSDYISGKPVDSGMMTNAGMYMIKLFAGSKNGGVQVTNPILVETTTQRKCIALAPRSVSVAMELNLLDVTQSPLKVNSWDITIDLWLNAMRNEGALVQQITTTI